MELHVLGSAGYHSNGYRETTCLMIPEVGIVFDAGSGFRRVQKLLNKVPANVELSVLLSHAHLDHSVGLTYGISVLLGTHRTIDVYGDIKHLAAVDQYLFDSPLFPLSRESAHVRLGTLDFHPRAKSNVNGVDIRVIPLPHPGGSTGFRLGFPNGDLVFITDTSAERVDRSFVRGARTLVHECTFSDQYAHLAAPSGHSHTAEVVRLAAEARVERLVLVHLNNIPELISGVENKKLAGEIPEHLAFEVIVADDTTIIEV